MDNPMLAIQLVLGLVFGIISAAVASSKGRSVVGWFFLSFLFGLIPMIVVCCLSNLTEEKSFKEHALREQHRLREQLAQERLKAEAFRSHTYDRLDTHDRVLGVDTRSGNPLGATGPMLLESHDPADALAALAGGPAAAGNVGTAPSASPSVGQEERIWYYECSGQAVGPITAGDLGRLVQNRQISPSTLVWCQSMTDWAPLAQVSALRRGEVS